jgi:hypothetical protein
VLGDNKVLDASPTKYSIREVESFNIASATLTNPALEVVLDDNYADDDASMERNDDAAACTSSSSMMKLAVGGVFVAAVVMFVTEDDVDDFPISVSFDLLVVDEESLNTLSNWNGRLPK